FSNAILPRTSGEVNSSYDGTDNSPQPSAARTRGRVTATRRPPRVTEPRSRPWRTAVRAWSCLPFGPANALALHAPDRVSIQTTYESLKTSCRCYVLIRVYVASSVLA